MQTRRYLAAKGQVTATFGADAIVMDLRSGAYFGLNDVGAFVWALLRSPKSVPDIIGEVMTAYEVDPERCQRDIHTLLERLESESLVQVVDITDREVRNPPASDDTSPAVG